jgi:hypothetical protein
MRTFALLSLAAPAVAFVPRAPVCQPRVAPLQSTSLTNMEAPTIEGWLNDVTNPQLGEYASVCACMYHW